MYCLWSIFKNDYKSVKNACNIINMQIVKTVYAKMKIVLASLPRRLGQGQPTANGSETRA
jgi:hypothetical protein